MKKVYIDELKKCDFCQEAALYDVPTKGGPWADLCQRCFDEHASFTACVLGYAFVLRSGDPKRNEGKDVITVDPIIDLFNDEMRVMCPSCGEIKTLEIDVQGMFSCDGCGQKVQI